MELAIFSGTPRFPAMQPVGAPIVEPEVRERFRRLADEAFDRNYLTNDGPLCRRLEEEVAARHGRKHAAFMANATIAQEVTLKAMGLREGEVLVAANTFIATAHVCEWLGLRPVFCDFDPESLNLDPADAERRITSRTAAVVPTHVFGSIADMPAITALAEKRGLKVLADAAHAFDCDREGIFPGGFGAPEFISFHATKFFSTFEGGAVLTDDRSLVDEVRLRRNFGFAGTDDAPSLGVNAKASEIAAAFGLASIPALERRRERLREVYELYIRELAGVPGIRVHKLGGNGRNNHRYFAVFVEEDFGLPRDAVCRALWRENVLARRYFYPGCHRMAYYRERYPLPDPPLAATDRALETILCLPTSFAGDHGEAVGTIAGIVKTIHEQSGRVRDWFRKEFPQG